MTETPDPQTAEPIRIPLTHSVHYVARGLPEVPNHYGPGVLAPSEITLTYRAAPDSQLGRVHAYVAGRIWVDGNELPLMTGGLYGQHYDDGLDGWPGWLAEEARLHDPDAVDAAPVDRAATVKQRADCTELEWAEQERARFERLYTREYTRAEQAEDLLKVAHETSNRSEAERASAVQRAEALAAAMESTAADALKHRGCHRDLMAQCLRAERAEAEAERLRTDRAAVLREAADELGRMDYDTDSNDYGYDTYRDAWNGGVMDGAELLRRMAAETPQPTQSAVHIGGNAEDCPACSGTNPPYPFICPGSAVPAQPGKEANGPTLRCNHTHLRHPHAPHAWEPQPGMDPVHCPGFEAAEEQR